MPSFDEIRETLNFGDRVLWLFILVAGATLLTIQTIESAIETAWPHQRRTGGRLPGERRAMPVMGIAAILVLAGAGPRREKRLPNSRSCMRSGKAGSSPRPRKSKKPGHCAISPFFCPLTCPERIGA